MLLIEAKTRLEHLLSELTSSDAQTVFSLKEPQPIPDALEIAVYAMQYLIDQGHDIRLVERKRAASGKGLGTTKYGPPNICTPNNLFVLTREKAELQIECAYALFLQKQQKKESEVEE